MHYHRTSSREYEAPTTTHDSLLLAEPKLTIYKMLESGGGLFTRNMELPASSLTRRGAAQPLCYATARNEKSTRPNIE